MIYRAIYCTSLTWAELKFLASIKPWAGKHWDNHSNNHKVVQIKNKLRQQLESSQKICSYCGLKLGGTSRGEIEHIAPKASFRNPEFTFTLKNLTLSCHYCNSFEKKGTKKVIDERNRLYSTCTFFIVHPYFDDPDDHYEWTDNEFEVLIQVKNGSQKALFSINLFGLDSLVMNELRVQQLMYERSKVTKPLSIENEFLLNETLNYKEEIT